MILIYPYTQEEASSLRRKADRAKKLEQTSVDEVLQAEINEYKVFGDSRFYLTFF